MAESFRDQALRPLPPAIYKEAMRLGATARLDAGDYAWVLMAAAAMITHSPVLRGAARPRLVSSSFLVIVTALVLIGALLLAGWVGAHGWTGYLASEIGDLESQRALLEVDAPSWASKWTRDGESGASMLFAAGHQADDVVKVRCHVGVQVGVCIGIRD